MRGTVKWFNEGKGYGFIRPDGASGDRDEDLFVHFRQVERLADERTVRLAEGETVEFEVGQDQRGRRCAVGVRRV